MRSAVWLADGLKQIVLRKADSLFSRIANFPALTEAARRAARGKRQKPSAAAFLANLEREVLRIERELLAGTWRPGRYVIIDILDPKPRRVSAAPFRDRVLHHALCSVVEPLFERGFIFDSYANRRNKGSHRAIARYEQYRDRYRHVLRCDIYRYFPAIDHVVLKCDLRQRIACEPTLALLDAIIDGSNAQEPVNRYFPGDDLFAPYERRRGLPIGNLTSQFFANLYLDGFDHFVKEVLRAPYLRYVDDFALFADDAAQLAQWRTRIEHYLEGRRLLLHPDKSGIYATNQPAEFLGLVLLRGGWRRLPESSVRRFRNRLRGLRDSWGAGSVSEDSVDQHIQAWIAHARHADSFRLRRAIFRGGWFDPSGEPLRRPGGLPVPSAWCAAVPGTTIHRTCAPLTATGTPPQTGTTTTVSVLPVHADTRTATVKAVSGEFGCVQGLP